MGSIKHVLLEENKTDNQGVPGWRDGEMNDMAYVGSKPTLARRLKLS